MSTMQPPDETPRQEQPTSTAPAPSYDILSSTPPLPAEHISYSTQPVYIGMMVVVGFLIAVGLLLRVLTGSTQPMVVAAILSWAIGIGGSLYVWAASRPSR